ncbi:MAG: cyanophycin synthetase [bacterium]|nr:cyanophycin synthetase [bacterium]
MLELNNFYLVGIKGVAMTALASCLLDAGKQVRGSDVAEDFPTKNSLKKLAVKVDIDFDKPLPQKTQVVIFSGANGGSKNPQVLEAQKRHLLVLSHAQALSEFFNLQKGVAVCGVGGKSTISAMLAFVTQKLVPQSFAVGVGEIIGMEKIGQFLPASDYFIAEADEYVADPVAAQAAIAKGEPITPRFSYLEPQITICSNLHFDHPDVYRDLAHTKQVYLDFFRQIKTSGTLIYNGDDENLLELADILCGENRRLHLISFGTGIGCDFRLTDYQSSQGTSTFKIRTPTTEILPVQLNLPGEFNAANATAALAALAAMKFDLKLAADTLKDYHSVKRRFEFMGERNGVLCYDDYAHHPDEVRAAIAAIYAWYPDRPIVIAFQSHTYSRTKQLFTQFVDAFAPAQKVVMIDIFPSAREAFDPSVTSDMLCQAIKQKFPDHQADNLKTIAALRKFLQQQKAGTVFVTVGAGDIYQVYE